MNELGLLKVGPESAGAMPGPACYGRGGTLPTVTDADLVLGYLNPDYFAGGQVKLDRNASERALLDHVAEPLGVGTLKAAWGVHTVVNEAMANALKVSVAEAGGDVQKVTMVASGGAGPVHAAQLARGLKIPQVLVPPCAGVASALGFLLAPLAYDIIRTHKVELERLDLSRAESLLEQMESEASKIVAEAAPQRPSVTKRFAELCFVGQGYPVMIALPDDSLEGTPIRALREAFFAAYRDRYGHCSEEFPVELVSLRVTVSVDSEPLPPFSLFSSGPVENALKGEREAFDALSQGMLLHRVYDRYLLPADASLEGPVLIEERETTTVVPSGASASVCKDGALLIRFT